MASAGNDGGARQIRCRRTLTCKLTSRDTPWLQATRACRHMESWEACASQGKACLCQLMRSSCASNHWARHREPLSRWLSLTTTCHRKRHHTYPNVTQWTKEQASESMKLKLSGLLAWSWTQRGRRRCTCSWGDVEDSLAGSLIAVATRRAEHSGSDFLSMHCSSGQHGWHRKACSATPQGTTRHSTAEHTGKHRWDRCRCRDVPSASQHGQFLHATS
jgi:hypothetical protein